jgi:hypothetical protein
MFHFFPYKLARLRAGRFALTRILARASDGVLFWHNKDVSPLPRSLEVKNPTDVALLRDKTRGVANIDHRNHNKKVAIAGHTKLFSRPCAQSFS